jgi:hypothetical protein
MLLKCSSRFGEGALRLSSDRYTRVPGDLRGGIHQVQDKVCTGIADRLFNIVALGAELLVCRRRTSKGRPGGDEVARPCSVASRAATSKIADRAWRAAASPSTGARRRSVTSSSSIPSGSDPEQRLEAHPA